MSRILTVFSLVAVVALALGVVVLAGCNSPASAPQGKASPAAQTPQAPQNPAPTTVPAAAPSPAPEAKQEGHAHGKAESIEKAKNDPHEHAAQENSSHQHAAEKPAGHHHEPPAVRPVEKADPEGLKELSAADRALAEKQAVCPVSGDPLGSMGKPFKVTVKGRTVFLCCEGCKDDINKDPDKYLAKLDAAK